MSIAHVTLSCRDVAATARFLSATFRWPALDRPVNARHDAAWFDLGDGQELHLIGDPAFEPSPFEGEFGRHVAFRVDREDYADLRDRLAAQGGVIIEPGRATPFARFFVRAPDGYVFEVIERSTP